MQRFSKATTGDYVALISALVMLFAFLVFPVAYPDGAETQETLSGLTLLNGEMPFFVWLIPGFALLGAIGAYWRITNSDAETKAITLSLVSGVGGLIMLTLLHNISLEQGPGFWLALFGAIGLILQFFMLHSSARQEVETAEAAKEHAEELAQRANSPLAKAWHQHMVDRDDSAIEEFEKVLEENPDDLDALYGLGLAQSQSDQKAEALATFQRIQKTLSQITTDDEDKLHRVSMLSRMVNQQIEALQESN